MALLWFGIDEKLGWRKKFFFQKMLNSNGVTHKIKITDGSKHVLKLRQNKSSMTPKKLQYPEVLDFLIHFWATLSKF